MMMPANYSVIAENEMTYVNGGASFIDAIGGNTTWKEVGNIGKNLFGTNVKGDPIEKNNFGDYAMNALGIAAAVYNLGVAPTKNTVKETEVKFTV